MLKILSIFHLWLQRYFGGVENNEKEIGYCQLAVSKNQYFQQICTLSHHIMWMRWKDKKYKYSLRSFWLLPRTKILKEQGNEVFVFNSTFNYTSWIYELPNTCTSALHTQAKSFGDAIIDIFGEKSIQLKFVNNKTRAFTSMPLGSSCALF